MRIVNNIKWLVVMLAFAVSMTSCVVKSTIFNSSGPSREAREISPRYFVEKNDGTIVEAANDTRLRDPLFKKAFIELDGDSRIPLAEVRAYQNQEAYYLRTPMGFAPRVINGPISQYQLIVYRTSYEPMYGGARGAYSGTRTSTRPVIYNYLQKDVNGPLLEPTERNIRILVEDYKPSVAMLDDYLASAKKYKRAGLYNTLGAIVGLGVAYGGANMGNNGNEAVMYAGAGILTGSLIYGFINRGRKAKNAVKLSDAVLEYNQHYSKRRN